MWPAGKKMIGGQLASSDHLSVSPMWPLIWLDSRLVKKAEYRLNVKFTPVGVLPPIRQSKWFCSITLTLIMTYTLTLPVALIFYFETVHHKGEREREWWCPQWPPLPVPPRYISPGSKDKSLSLFLLFLFVLLSNRAFTKRSLFF